MAGPHQIWKLDLEDRQDRRLGRLGLREHRGRSLPTPPEFAQPSGLATDGENLFVADSEVSGVRVITGLAADHPEVGRIVGQGLFEFGDIDGTGPEVRLQHCLGVAYGDGKLFIADTYNNKVKVCDPEDANREDLRRRRQARQYGQPTPLLPARRPERGGNQPLRGRHQQPQDPRDRPQDGDGRNARDRSAGPFRCAGTSFQLTPFTAGPKKLR